VSVGQGLERPVSRRPPAAPQPVARKLPPSPLPPHSATQHSTHRMLSPRYNSRLAFGRGTSSGQAGPSSGRAGPGLRVGLSHRLVTHLETRKGQQSGSPRRSTHAARGGRRARPPRRRRGARAPLTGEEASREHHENCPTPRLECTPRGRLAPSSGSVRQERPLCGGASPARRLSGRHSPAPRAKTPVGGEASGARREQREKSTR
jgi:hypothetical protein